MIYVIDHKDSFTHNVVHQLSLFDKVECDDFSKINLEDFSDYIKISNCVELQNMRNNLNGKYVLINSIGVMLYTITDLMIIQHYFGKSTLVRYGPAVQYATILPLVCVLVNKIFEPKIAKLIASQNNTEISKVLGTVINFDYKVDENLIGGLKMQIGSLMVDTSIKNKLKKYEQIMLEA